MELKVGMYVRTKSGMLAKIIDKRDVSGSLHQEETLFILDNGNRLALNSKKLKKASYEITDLIKPKDFIVGKDGLIYQVDKILKDYVFTKTKNKYSQVVTPVDYQIDKILTHEQFEIMAYKVDQV